MKTALLIWASQFAVWFRLSWPIAKVAWEVLKDGEITLEEFQAAISEAWPHVAPPTADYHAHRVIRLPWAQAIKDKADAPV